MNCGRCGGQLRDDDSFCARCGTRVDVWTAPETVVFAPPPFTPPVSNDKSSNKSANKVLIAAVAALVVAVGTTVGIVVAHTLGGRTSTGGPVAQASSKPAKVAAAETVPASSKALAPDFASVYAKEQSGVVRIEVVGCSDSGIGTGFLLSPTLVATVDHVVSESTVVSLAAGDQHTTGQVIGSDPDHDLALVRVDSPLTGYHFRFAEASPQVGDRVAAIGFPIGDPITLTQGGVSGLERDIDVDGRHRSGLVETDTPVNPGNSGGPLLAADGTVVGLVDALNTSANGIAYAVPASQAGPQMTQWTRSPGTVAPASCTTPLGPSQEQTAIPAISGLDAGASSGISSAFETYFDGINTGDYDAAWHVLSPRLRSGSSLESFADGDATSFDFAQRVIDATQIDPSTATVVLEFTSIQASDKGPDGDTCDDWTLVYTMVEGSDGTWYIDATTPYHGSSHTSC